MRKQPPNRSRGSSARRAQRTCWRPWASSGPAARSWAACCPAGSHCAASVAASAGGCWLPSASSPRRASCFWTVSAAWRLGFGDLWQRGPGLVGRTRGRLTRLGPFYYLPAAFRTRTPVPLYNAPPPTAHRRHQTQNNPLPEPTTGLDSCSALSVVEHLRDRAADTGLTIVASIHQPRAAVWAAFDSVALLSEGSLLYAGPCSEIVAWFESVGLGPWRPDVHGTACDWVMDLVNIGFDNKPQVGAAVRFPPDAGRALFAPLAAAALHAPGHAAGLPAGGSVAAQCTPLLGARGRAQATPCVHNHRPRQPFTAHPSEQRRGPQHRHERRAGRCRRPLCRAPRRSGISAAC